MTIFNDENRTVEIVITTWDEAIGQWSADWSEYFYDAVAKDVKDVQYYIDQATDMRDGKGDYADGDPHPDVAVTVTELDHDDYMRGHMVRASDPEGGELCSIRWVEDDLRSWLADHDYPVTDANLQAMRDMVDPKTLREAGIQAGWWAIEAMIDERRLATDDNGRDADALSCDPADPVNLSMTGADTSSMGVAL